MRRIVRRAVLLLLALVLAACSGSPLDGATGPTTDQGTPGTTAASATSAPEEPAPTTTAIEPFRPAGGEDLAAFFRSEYGDTNWVADLQDVVFTTYLGRPIVEILFGGTRDEIDPFGDEVLDLFHDGVVDVDAFVQIWSSEGRTQGSNFRSDSTSRALPPPPESVDQVAGWVDAAYGPSSADPVDEPWVEVALEATYELVQEADGDLILEIDGFEMSASNIDDPYAWHQVSLLISALQAGGVGFGWADYISVEARWGEFNSGSTTSAITEAEPPMYDL